jgi:hypothetical protein
MSSCTICVFRSERHRRKHDDPRRQWWGDAESLHLDCWGAVEQADGFDVELTREIAPGSTDRLFFVNLGCYDPREFNELHKNILLVAEDAIAAKAKALVQIGSWSLPHKDKVFEVEKAVDITASMQRYGYFLRLTKAVAEKPFEFSSAIISRSLSRSPTPPSPRGAAIAAAGRRRG